MAEKINPTEFPAAGALAGTEVLPVHQLSGWKSITLSTIKTWLATFFESSANKTTSAASLTNSTTKYVAEKAMQEHVKQVARTILLSDYGVTGTGDETTAVQAAFNDLANGSTLVFDTDFETTSVVYFPTDIETFKVSGGNRIWKNYSSAALRSAAPFAMYSGLSVSLTEGVDSFTIPGGVSLSIGDFILLTSSTEGPVATYYNGAISRIYEIAGGKAYLDIAPYRTFTADEIEVSKGYENVEIEGIVFDQSGMTTEGSRTLELFGVTGANIHHNEFSGSDNMLLGANILGNNIVVSNNLSEGYLDINGNRTGYCLSVGGSNILVENNITINGKHNITVGHRRWIDSNVTIRNNQLYQDPAFSGLLDSMGRALFWSIADVHANTDKVTWENNTILGVADVNQSMINVRNGRSVFDNNTIKQLAGVSTIVIKATEAPLEYLKIHGGEITMLAPSELLSDAADYLVTNISGVKTTNVNWNGSTIGHMYNMPQFTAVDETNSRIGVNNDTPLASLSVSSTATSGNALELVKDSSVTVSPTSMATYKNNDSTNGNAALFTFGSKMVSPATSYAGAQIGALFTSHANDATRNSDFIITTQNGTSLTPTEKFRVTGTGEVIVTGGGVTANAFSGDGSLLTNVSAQYNVGMTRSFDISTTNLLLAPTDSFVKITGTHASNNIQLGYNDPVYIAKQSIIISNQSAQSLVIVTAGIHTIDGSSGNDSIGIGVTKQITLAEGSATDWHTVPVGSGTVTSVTSANTDLSVATTTTTPVITANTGIGANQIVKLDSNARLGVGTASPFQLLHVVGSSAQILATGSANAGSIRAYYDNGATAPTAANVGLGSLYFGALESSATARVGTEIGAYSEAAWTYGTSHPSYIKFTTAPSGSVTRAERLRITSTAIVAAVPVRLKGYTVATLPAGTQGDTAFCTDLLLPAFLAAAVGGGAVVGPVFYNGAAWVSY